MLRRQLSPQPCLLLLHSFHSSLFGDEIVVLCMTGHSETESRSSAEFVLCGFVHAEYRAQRPEAGSRPTGVQAAVSCWMWVLGTKLKPSAVSTLDK